MKGGPLLNKFLLPLLLTSLFLFSEGSPAQARTRDAGQPISDWYFAIALERGWFGWHTYYCSSRWKDGNASSAVDCSETAVPYTSLFTFLAAGGAKGPAKTGQPLSLLSLTNGPCATSQAPDLPYHSSVNSQEHLDWHHNSSSARVPTAQQHLTVGDGPVGVTGVSCAADNKLTSTFTLHVPETEPGQPIPYSTPVFLREGDRFCTVASTSASERGLVCNLDSTDGAVKFLLFPTAYPYASLSSLYTRGSCGVKSLMEPPVHDVVCSPSQHLLGQAQARGTHSLQELAHIKMPAWEEDELRRESRLTLVTQTPGQPLVSGVIVGLHIFYPGLVGRLLQTCCATKEPPHVVYCEAAADAIDAECWFQLIKIDTGSGTKLPLSDGSLVSLTAYAAGRFCSTAYDATLLCASASFSNASRNLFTLRLGED